MRQSRNCTLLYLYASMCVCMCVRDVFTYFDFFFFFLRYSKNMCRPKQLLDYDSSSLSIKYWVGQKVHLGFSITSYRKYNETFWPTQYLFGYYTNMTTVSWFCAFPNFLTIPSIKKYISTAIQ